MNEGYYMNISKADRKRFLELVESGCVESVETAKDFLDGVFDLSYVEYKIKTPENSSYIRRSLIVIYTKTAKESVGTIRFKDLKQRMSSDDIELIYRVLNNYNENFKYVYTCKYFDSYAVIEKNTIITGLLSSIHLELAYPIWLFLDEPDADCSDEIWGRIENNREMLVRFLKIYLENPGVFSEPIQKRLQYDYDNILGDSDKLLLELGEDLL